MNNQDRALIKDYIYETLSDEQRQAVEKRIAEDEHFRRELLAEKERQSTRPAALEESRPKARNEVQDTRPLQVEPTVTSQNGRWWIIAAAIALIIGGIYYLLQDSATSSEQLFAEYFEPYPLSAYTVATEGNEVIPAALEAYREGDYQEAVNRFETTDPAVSTARSFTFYYALSLLGNRQGEEAIPMLQAVIDQSDARGVAQPAEWYLALGYLQSGKEDQALEILNRIIRQPEHEMNHQAELLVGALKA